VGTRAGLDAVAKKNSHHCQWRELNPDSPVLLIHYTFTLFRISEGITVCSL